MYKLLTVLAILAVLGIAAFLIIRHTGKNNLSGITLTEDDSGREVSLRVGEKLKIILKSNPSTGYQWDVAPFNESVIKLSEGPLVYEKKKIPGGEGETVFVFEAVSPGTTTIKLMYRRPWEKFSPASTFEVTVKVD